MGDASSIHPSNQHPNMQPYAPQNQPSINASFKGPVSPAAGQMATPGQPSKPSLMIQLRTVFMNEEKQNRAVELAKEAISDEKISQSPREIAGHIKLGFDTAFGPCWHCVVGRSYGSFVTHGRISASLICLLTVNLEKENFIFFYVDHWAIMLFKTA